MKTTLMKSLLLASFTMILATGCGKKDKPAAPAPVQNPVQQEAEKVVAIGSHLSGTALSNFNELSSWYNSTNENDLFGIKEKRELIIYKAEECKTKTFIVKWQVCETNRESTTTVENFVVLIQNGARKNTNARLAQVFDGSQGKIVDVQFLGYSGKGAGQIFEVIIQKANGQPKMFQIDTGYNSIFNPTRIKDPENRSEDVLRLITSY